MEQLIFCVTCNVRLIEGYYNDFKQSSNKDIDIQWQSNIGEQYKTIIINNNDIHPLCMEYQVEYENLRKNEI